MNLLTRLALAFMAVALLGGCGAGTTTPAGPACPQVQIPAAVGDTVTLENGLRYITTVEGTGAIAQPTHRVTVHYTGYLPDGTRFDTSVGGDPITFEMNQVVAGFAQGITGMRVGGTRRIIIPPQLGYGASPPRGTCIPPNATMIFDVELFRVSGG